MDGSRTHDGSYRPDTDFEDQEAHRDFTIPAKRIIQNQPPCNPTAIYVTRPIAEICALIDIK